MIGDFVRTFGDQPPGALVTLLGSTGSLLVCQVNGNAAQTLGAQAGDALEIYFGH